MPHCSKKHLQKNGTLNIIFLSKDHRNYRHDVTVIKDKSGRKFVKLQKVTAIKAKQTINWKKLKEKSLAIDAICKDIVSDY